jgi:DNA-directed RNA polymerase specialized sigma24 family protein
VNDTTSAEDTPSEDTPSEDTPMQRALALREQYFVPLAKFAFTRGATRHQAEAIADDAVMDLARTEPGSVREEPGWLYNHARCALIQIYRARRTSREVATDMEIVAGHLEQTTWSSAELRLEVLDTLRALQTLPEIYRDAVALATAGLTDSEIAAVLDITTNTAAQRVSRGRKQLAAATGRSRAKRTSSTQRSPSILRTIEEGRSE